MRTQATLPNIKCDGWTRDYKDRCTLDATFVVIRRDPGDGGLLAKEFCSHHYLADLLRNGHANDIHTAFIAFSGSPIMTDRL